MKRNDMQMTRHQAADHTTRGWLLACALAAAPGVAAAQVPANIGIDQPVSSAMRQIVPPGHVVRFGPGVSPQTHVDWHTDGDWREAMRQALASKRLHAVTRGDTIEVVSDEPIAATPARPTRPRPVAQRRSKPADEDLAPAPVAGWPVLTPADVDARGPLPYPNAPAGTSAPTSPTLPAPTYAPPQSYVVPPKASYPNAPIALARPPVPNYDPPLTEQRYAVAGTFHANANAYLDDTINQWCNQAGGGWALNRSRPTCIDAKTDLRFKLTNSITLNEGFAQAVVHLVNAIHAPIAPYVRVHARSYVVELTDSDHLSQSSDE